MEHWQIGQNTWNQQTENCVLCSSQKVCLHFWYRESERGEEAADTCQSHAMAKDSRHETKMFA